MTRSTQPQVPADDPAFDKLLAAGELVQGGRRHRRSDAAAPAPHADKREPERQLRPAHSLPHAPALQSTLLLAHGIPHGFSVRTGGATTCYGSAEGDLNLGFTASDTRENVLENRARLLRHVFGSELPLMTLSQRHTSLLHQAQGEDAGESATRVGDALHTDRSDIALGVQTADCAPVLVAAKNGRVVAAFHAGWRGTLARIVEAGIGRLRMEYGIAAADLIAAIGPSIRACCYAVGEEVEAEFRSQFSYAEELFFDVYDTDPVRKKYPMLFLTQRAPGHSDLGPSRHLDLAEANRRQLLSAGLLSASIDVLEPCTACRSDLFFSHRGEAGFTGRMLNVIGVPHLGE